MKGKAEGPSSERAGAARAFGDSSLGTLLLGLCSQDVNFGPGRRGRLAWVVSYTHLLGILK